MKTLLFLVFVARCVGVECVFTNTSILPVKVDFSYTMVPLGFPSVGGPLNGEVWVGAHSSVRFTLNSAEGSQVGPAAVVMFNGDNITGTIGSPYSGVTPTTWSSSGGDDVWFVNTSEAYGGIYLVDSFVQGNPVSMFNLMEYFMCGFVFIGLAYGVGLARSLLGRAAGSSIGGEV